MTISLIVAMAKNRGIGKDNAMPWHLPADFAWFKATTMGHPIVMGRKTWESIGKPLPGRRNIVVTRNAGFHAEGVEVAHSLDEALRMAGDDAFVIGGAVLFGETLPHADRIYLTEVDAVPECDTFFPALGAGEWHEISRTSRLADEKNAFDMAFVILQRVEH